MAKFMINNRTDTASRYMENWHQFVKYKRITFWTSRRIEPLQRGKFSRKTDNKPGGLGRDLVTTSRHAHWQRGKDRGKTKMAVIWSTRTTN